MTHRCDVLVVEDELVVREAARKILLEENLAVAMANDVDEAVAILEGTSCRLVLTDLMLPGASGFDLLGLTRKRWPSTEVVVITGYATVDHAVMTFREGAFDFVPKPFDIGELLGVVRRALRFSADRPALLALAPSTSEDEVADERNDSCYFLGRHSWARLHTDGSATLGVAETFPRLLDKIEQLELPAPEEHSRQGQLLARILAQGEIVYRVWSPLSGTVLAANPRISHSIDLIDRDPCGAGWLIRIIPHDLDRELELLDRRRFGLE